MEWLSDVDWGEVFIPSTPLLEIFVRGTLTYLSIFFLLRVVLKRESGAVGMSDLLVVVLIADAAQNAMGDDYRSIPDGIVLVAVIVGWAYLLDWLGYHSRRFERLLKPPKLPLVENGVLRVDNMRRELVTREELRSQLRQQGVEDLSRVRAAYMEHDGRISVLTNDASRHQPSEHVRAL